MILNLAIPYFAGNKIFYVAYLIIGSIQLGGAAGNYIHYGVREFGMTAIANGISLTARGAPPAARALRITFNSEMRPDSTRVPAPNRATIGDTATRGERS